MPEVPFSGALVSDASSADAAKNTPSQWKRAILAAFLSFLIPGMGQLYNRQPKKALILAATTWIFSLIASQTRILFLFSSMIAFFVLFIAWRLFIVVDAACGAGGAKATQVSVSSKLTYSVVAVFLVAGALFPTNAQFKRWSGFAAFKVPSMSMCPTICSDERIVVDMKAYKSRPPTHGDVVVLEHDSQAPLFIKRVIGIPGDHVGPGRDGAILVNGVPLAIPQACGRSTQKVESAGDDYPSFQHTKAPNGTLFVVGDNLASSLDSRYSQFGQVKFEELRGKPLYLYWSQDRTRIGCTIH